MLQRLTINLSKPEQEALERIAAIEIRDMRDQARFILRQELERRGFLQEDPQTNPCRSSMSGEIGRTTDEDPNRRQEETIASKGIDS